MKRTRNVKSLTSILRAKDYPDSIIISKTKSNRFRYAVRYITVRLVLRAAVTYTTAGLAYNAAVVAAKAHHMGEMNFIE